MEYTHGPEQRAEHGGDCYRRGRVGQPRCTWELKVTRHGYRLLNKTEGIPRSVVEALFKHWVRSSPSGSSVTPPFWPKGLIPRFFFILSPTFLFGRVGDKQAGDTTVAWLFIVYFVSVD